MQEIIASLSEIDEKSAKIMEAANNELKSLSEKLNIRKEDYLNQAKQRNQEQLDELRRQLKEESDQQQEKQTSDFMETLSQLEKEYDEQHEVLVEQIFQSITSETLR